MTTKQESRLAMYLAVRDFIEAHHDETKNLPEFSTLFEALRNSINELHKASEMQKPDKTGLFREKMIMKQKLATMVHDISVKLSAYATIHNNLILLGEVTYPKSTIDRFNDNALDTVARIIYSLAEENVDVMKEYGITSGTIATFLEAINAFDSSMTKPRIGQTDKHQATVQIAALIEQIESLLKKIDALMKIIMNVNPGFYSVYRNVRKVINKGKLPLGLKGKAFEIPGRRPLRGVMFMFVREDNKYPKNNGAVVLVKKTARKGIFYVKSIPEGTYVVTATKTGYKQAKLSVSINPGERSMISVDMEKA